MTYRDQIVSILDKQIAKGMKEYGMLLDNNPRPAVEAIDFALEEGVDWLMYLSEIKEKVKGLLDEIARKDSELAYCQTLLTITNEQLNKYRREIERARRGYKPMEMEE